MYTIEEQNILKKYSIKSFDELTESIWYLISHYQKLSEKFIEKYENKVSWDLISKYQKLSEKFIEKYENKVNWNYISFNQKLSEKFIEKYENKVNWNLISQYQKLSEKFIEKYENKVYWDYISAYQKLSEKFIEKYENKVNWINISYNQKLSEKFIEKYENKVNWNDISINQKLSEKFIEKYKDKINIEIQEKNFKEKTLEEKLKEIKEYAKEHNLEFKNNKLIAYRNHDMHNRGVWNKTISYEKGKYYKDWRCNMNKEEENSFGLGVFPKGNTKVEVKVEDWGCEVGREDGKARVFGFKVI